ncbi:MAG: DUF835 domain-containing protein [archaeon]|jgi:hypothetical protein|nr:DUF835 domain-containing protein [archaeon]MDA1130343.1 DUF835 domain-containing protein [archaeon]
MEQGRLYTAELSNNSALYPWLDKQLEVSQQQVLLFSRQPHKRLLEYIDLSKIESYWLSDRTTAGAITPRLEKIAHIITSKLPNDHGLIVIEGLEWLVSLHGEDAVLSFIRQIRDEAYKSSWKIIFPINCLVFDSVWLARLRREAPEADIFSQIKDNLTEFHQEHFDIQNESIEEIKIHNFQQMPGEDIELDTIQDGSPKLVMLTRLPSNGFSNSILTRRILQWRRMGLDVSEVEPALTIRDEKVAHQLYSSVEEKVRRAVQLENHLEAISDNISATELTTARFRIRQLTGLDELEKWLLSL